MLSGLGLVPAVAAGYVISKMACKVFVEIYLSQQQEFEADILGTAISKAAKCSDDDIVESSARTCIGELLLLENILENINTVDTDSAVLQHKALALLKCLVPECQLPDTVEDSKSLAACENSIQKGLGLLSNKERNEAYKMLDDLWVGVAFRRAMHAFLVQPCASHPHWFDRILTFREVLR